MISARVQGEEGTVGYGSKKEDSRDRAASDEVMAQLDAVCDMEANREDRPMEREQVLKKIADREGLLSMITDRVDAELMDRAPKLKIISNLAVGYNNIDVAAATARGIAVTNTPAWTTEPTADLTFGLISPWPAGSWRRTGSPGRGNSSTGRPCSFSDDPLRKRHWDRRLRRNRAGRGKEGPGFDMRILYTRRRRLERNEGNGSWGSNTPTSPGSSGSSDFVSLHVPLTDETRHLIGAKELRQMKPTAFPHSMPSRGPVVNEKELVEALGKGVIAGAGLDVYENEPALAPGLTDLPNVVLTPHVGSGTIEDRTLMAGMATDNLLAGLEGRKSRASSSIRCLQKSKK